MILLSVIIPTYKRPELLKKCLVALEQQALSKYRYEVIVVSDGPDELTKKTVVEFSRGKLQVHFFQMPARKGPAAARNYGWRRAKGILIAFTDDDTLPGKDWLRNIWKAYRGEEDIVYTGKIKVPLSESPTDYEKNTAGLETAEFVTANCCCTKAALAKTGGFDERFSMAWREDSDLEFRLILHRIPIRHLPGALVVHPVRHAPWGVSIKEQKKGMYNALLYKKYPTLYRKKIQPIPPWNYYVTVISFALLTAGLLFRVQWLSTVAFACWIFLLIKLIAKRLRHTSKAFTHVAEMIITSICIPFISVYWQLYGAWRYKVLFL